MARTFVVQNSPSNEYALSHMVYMNPVEVGAPYVSIGPFVYRCAAHPDVKPGHIALNAIHRRQNLKMAGDTVHVSDFVPPSNFNIQSVTLKASWLKPSQDPPPSDLGNKFRTDFEGYVLTKDQLLTLQYGDKTIYVTVLSNTRGLLTMKSEVGVQWEED